MLIKFPMKMRIQALTDISVPKTSSRDCVKGYDLSNQPC